MNFLGNLLCNLIHNGPRFAMSWASNERAAKRRMTEKYGREQLRAWERGEARHRLRAKLPTATVVKK